MARQVLVLVGTSNGVFICRSDTSRQRWRIDGPCLAGQEVYGLLGDSRRNHRLFAGTANGGGPSLHISDDFGAIWRPAAAGPRYGDGSGFSVSRVWQIVPGAAAEPDTVFAGVEDAGLFVSRDGGETWEEVDGFTHHPTRPDWFPGNGGLCLHTILLDPANPRRMWVAMSAVGVFQTDDGGATWQARVSGLALPPMEPPYPETGYCVHKVAQDPRDPYLLYMQDHAAVFRSTDGAASWSLLEGGLPPQRAVLIDGFARPAGFAIGVAPSRDVFLIQIQRPPELAARGGMFPVYRLDDDGVCWEVAGEVALASPGTARVLRDGLTFDSLEPYGAYFGTAAGELFYSLDRGGQWQRIPGPFGRIITLKTWLVDG